MLYTVFYLNCSSWPKCEYAAVGKCHNLSSNRLNAGCPVAALSWTILYPYLLYNNVLVMMIVRLFFVCKRLCTNKVGLFLQVCTVDIEVGFLHPACHLEVEVQDYRERMTKKKKNFCMVSINGIYLKWQCCSLSQAHLVRRDDCDDFLITTY